MGHTPLGRIGASTLLLPALLILASAQPTSAAQAAPVAATESPWGISSSASAIHEQRQWLPVMAEAGVATVRLFPEWRQIEPTPGTWHWQRADALVQAASASGIEVSGLLLGAPAGSRAIHRFPMEHLDDWSRFVAQAVGRYRQQIRYWEVWNEGNGAFNNGRHTTVDYARLAARSYAAAKQANPQAQVGLTVASFDAPYLEQTILAMARAGQANSFDYLCIHPYELAGGIAHQVDGEIPFLWMSRLLRDMLQVRAPQRAAAPIWISEVGQQIGRHYGLEVTPQDAAKTLAKVYVLAMAQGIARTLWFEARDPSGEAPGFGLLARNGRPREGYRTLDRLSSSLGPHPTYLGWLALGTQGRGYGFVFDTPDGPRLVAWMPKGLHDTSISLPVEVQLTDLLSGTRHRLPAGQPLALSDTPVLLDNLPDAWLHQARGNASADFPWGGNYREARTVSIQPGTPDAQRGVFHLDDARPLSTFADGSTGLLLGGDGAQPVKFYVHPSFASLQTRRYYIRISVRRLTAGNVGMNLLYEIADSQGRSPYVSHGQWFAASAEPGWQTHTWQLSDAAFAKMWGYDFAISTEQSELFVLGKVEVSLDPFEPPAAR